MGRDDVRRSPQRARVSRLSRYAHEHGCPWDGATCASAARGSIWSACDMHMRMDARGRGHLPSAARRASGVPAREWMHMRMDAHMRDGAGATCASAARGAGHQHMRMDARGTCTPAHEGIWMDMHMRMGPGATCASACASAARMEGIWSACDMHMRMDARGTGPPARQQLGRHLECLRYAHENGCPWGRGHLQVSSRGRASGVPAICT